MGQRYELYILWLEHVGSTSVSAQVHYGIFKEYNRNAEFSDGAFGIIPPMLDGIGWWSNQEEKNV